MKKNFKYVIPITAIVLVIAVATTFFFVKSKKRNTQNDSTLITQQTSVQETFFNEQTEETTVENTTIKTTLPHKPNKPIKPNKPQPQKPEIKTIDGWLQIISVGDYGGKLSFTIKNASKEDIEFAIIGCKAGKQNVTFKVTALLAGKKALIVCNENIKYDAQTNYDDWIIENKVVYPEKRSLKSDVFAFKTTDGAIEITNISDKDINGTIFICYKRADKDVYIAEQTYRTKLDGLNKGETKTVPASRFNQGIHEVIFIDYED